MNLPDGWERFYEDVYQKVKTLSKVGIWSTDASNMLAWLGNFQKDEHRYIAAHILDRLTFRSQKMQESSYRSFLSSTFKTYFEERSGATGLNINDWLNGLADKPSNCLEDILICPVSNAGESGESGDELIRLLTGDLIHQDRTFRIDTTSLASLVGKTILIVDDFLGSGDQFIDFASSPQIREAASNNNIIYVPTLAFYKGLNNLKDNSYGIEVFPLEIVGENERFFSHMPGASFSGDDINTEADVLRCYHEMRQLDNSFKKKYWLGRDKASLCVAFQWGCPNQSLGAMWYRGGDNWSRLVRRRGTQ